MYKRCTICFLFFCQLKFPRSGITSGEVDDSMIVVDYITSH